MLRLKERWKEETKQQPTKKRTFLQSNLEINKWKLMLQWPPKILRSTMDAAVVAVGVWVSECVSVWWGIHIWHTYFGKSFCRTSTFHTFVSHHWYIFDEHIAISILWHLMKIQFAYLYIYIFYSILFSFIMFAHFYAYRSIVSLNISRSVLLFFFALIQFGMWNV